MSERVPASELQQKADKPFVPGRRPVAVHLGEVPRQAVVDQRVLDLVRARETW
jgi:hypothetical protein